MIHTEGDDRLYLSRLNAVLLMGSSCFETEGASYQQQFIRRATLWCFCGAERISNASHGEIQTKHAEIVTMTTVPNLSELEVTRLLVPWSTTLHTTAERKTGWCG